MNLSPIKVRNASQAIDTVLSYLRKQPVPAVPDENTEWQDKTIYSTEPQDYGITSKLFMSDDWMIEVFQGVTPLSKTVYELTIFSARYNCHWKGSVRADGTVTEKGGFRVLSDEESLKIVEEYSRKSEITPPRPGGYGH